MSRVTLLHPAELSAADRAAWSRIAAADQAFDSPLLSPDFAEAVGAVRQDARVAVFRQDDRPVAFLPFHLRPGGFARPIGSPLSDYHALVAEPGLDLTLEQAVDAAGLTALRFTGLIESGASVEDAEVLGHLVRLEGGTAADYLERLRAASPKRFKNYRRLDHKLEREVGDIDFVARDLTDYAFNRMIDTKRDQLQRTGAHDYLRPDWTRKLVRDLFDRREGSFQGLMISMYAGGRWVAGHFGVRLGGVYHPWIASADPEFAAWSPGQVFLLRAIAAMDELGLTAYDLGPSHDHYKKPYALSQRPISQGLAVAPTPAGRVAGGLDQAWSRVGGDGHGAAGRLRRRLEVIASVELTVGGRVRGVYDALAGAAWKRRSLLTADEFS